MEKPTKSTRRPLADLAAPSGVTPAAIYRAAKLGLIPFIPAGAKLMITEEAFEYHLANGYGRHVPPYGS
ncbi:hypothetical protein PH7735_01790 [Shimia thalassica]|uniref:Helix-turn-helix domain protein n=1 Tax=Shimia thalassica TaxID=1715693 RepID=A0A0P1I750_9RHOB|nr:hypothetical protein [Shimia thalassica]CUJ94801.1 hypothetical protein PH7735_01790 [Shimia thalassica]